MEIVVQIINAFIDGESGGNPAGVVLDADEFSAIQKLEIAAKVGLSETAFVSSSKSADFKLWLLGLAPGVHSNLLISLKYR